MFFNVNYIHNEHVPLHNIGFSCFLIVLITYLLKLAVKAVENADKLKTTI